MPLFETAIKSLSGGTTFATGPGVSFANSPTVTFGVAGQTVTASAAGGAGGSGAAISAGTQSVATGTVVFSNSNGVSFGMAGSSQVTASVDGIKSIFGGTTRITNGEAVFADAGGVSFGVNGQTVTAAAPAQSVVPGIQSISAGTTQATTGQVVFANGSGVSFGINGQTMTASVLAQSVVPGIQSISGGTTRITTGQVVFADGGGVSFGVNGQTMTATVLPETPFGISASTQSVSTGTLVFSASNGISFGMSGSSRITAAFAAVKSVGFNTGTTNAINVQVDSFSLLNTLGISWSSNATNGRVFAAYGGGASVSIFQDPSGFADPGVSTLDGFISFYRLACPFFVSASEARFLVSLTSNNASDETFSISCGVYTMSGSTASLASSASRSFSVAGSNWSSQAGNQSRTVPVTFAITPGDYLFAVHARTAGNQGLIAFYGVHSNGVANIEATARYINGYSSASFSTAMPASFNLTDTNIVRTGSLPNAQPGFQYLA